MRRCSTRAILLRRRPLREADLLLTYLSEREGKLVGVAANARRSQRRFGGALEPGTVGSVAYAERPGSELVRVEEMRVEWSPLGRRDGLAVFAGQGILLEVAEATTVERQASSEKFTLLREGLHDLPQGPLVVTLRWLIRWLAAVGVAPEMNRCVRCGRPAEDVARFAPTEGGICCGACVPLHVWSVAAERHSLAAWTDAADGAATGCVPCSGQPPMTSLAGRPLFSDGLWRYLHHVVGRGLKSSSYWAMLWKETHVH